ncbi:hypothetical protein Pcinc_030790 [Petrolisthes cinctipes]|uniref:RIIa domain-containing protein n=1 Tax=Petrolisthes cinctipes TaxID=88211 RepID=A0AAE1EYJ8_PETCI|nr:hypothetical protein Pcinc_034796 [Petrolisthes cinctipes]KAK3863433.1 hypothetical protein Pcinc_030790 [Petrolisthes cinctipes]
MAGRGGGGGGGGAGVGGGGYEVPPGLQELLIEFTVAVLVERPPDLLAYASEYFSRLHEDRARQQVIPTTTIDDASTITDDEDDDEPMPGTV